MHLNQLTLINWGTYEPRTFEFLGTTLITGSNGSGKSMLFDAIQTVLTAAYVNVVRYNPLDPSRHGTEPPEEVIRRNAAVYRSRLPNARVSVIPRVGFDVAASCGMFFGPTGPIISPPRTSSRSD